MSFVSPPSAYSLLPFWFWNDSLNADELTRQIADFEDHGVHGFVIHPRVGLPHDCGWMSRPLLDFMQIALDEAARRGMTVLLYDEGMYPSGSASGQVVAKNPRHACRGLALYESDQPLPADHQTLLLTEINGRPLHIVDRPVDSVIRGLHYVGEGPAEDEPAMADILNPDAVASFTRLVYDRFADKFGEYFGKTILAIFTDEPNALGRVREKQVWPGTTDILSHVNRLLGEDFTPHLPALFLDDFPDAEHHRQRYHHAIRLRLEETWYTPLSQWCESHGVALCGHPEAGDEIGSLRHFQIPGQDLVWRWVEPNQPTAIEGPESTQGKASSSAALHLGRPRNGNEFCGAYGSETTFEELQWLARWCLVRGVDLLIPHAFYYSVRGPRRDERPPQVGPNAPWWDRFKPFADSCARLCHLNANSTPLYDTAILTSDRCPWVAAKELFEQQLDFAYLEDRLLLDGTARIADGEIHVGPMRYCSLVVEDESLLTPEIQSKLRSLLDDGRVHIAKPDGPDALVEFVAQHRPTAPLLDEPHTGLRLRRVQNAGESFALLFHEAGDSPISVRLADSFTGSALPIDLATGKPTGPAIRSLELEPYAMHLLRLDP